MAFNTSPDTRCFYDGSWYKTGLSFTGVVAFFGIVLGVKGGVDALHIPDIEIPVSGVASAIVILLLLGFFGSQLGKKTNDSQ